MSAPVLQSISFPRPKDAAAFERLIRDLAAKVFCDPRTDLHGRSGQGQAGVDIVCPAATGGVIGIQCKNVDVAAGRILTPAMVRVEIEKAKTFQPPLRELIVITTAGNDAPLQELARTVSAAHAVQGLFKVEVFGWDWVESQLRTWPDVAEQHALILRAPAGRSAVSRAIGERFREALRRINAGRDAGAIVGVTEIAQALGHTDWRDLEALADGAYAGDQVRLVQIAEGLGLNPDWLVHGKSAPFLIDRGDHDAWRQYEEILGLDPSALVVVRSCAAPFEAAVLVRIGALRWKLFGAHPAGPDVGTTGRHQLFEFACLLRRLQLAFHSRPLPVIGQRIEGSTFEALVNGDVYPGAVIERMHNDPWWQDFCEFDASLVEGDAAEAVALRKAIAILREMLAEYLEPGRDADWKRERLRLAALPDRGQATAARYHVDLRGGAAPIPAPSGLSSWPRVLALKLTDAKFTFTSSHDGTLLGGGCHLDVENCAKIPLKSCAVVVVAIGDGQTTTTIGAPLRSGAAAGCELRAGQKQRLVLCGRDLKDIVTRPPMQVRWGGVLSPCTTANDGWWTLNCGRTTSSPRGSGWRWTSTTGRRCRSKSSSSRFEGDAIPPRQLGYFNPDNSEVVAH